MVMRLPIFPASKPLNQQRSQLSRVYCTTSRNGGEVTVSCTLFAGISLVAQASLESNSASVAALRNRQRSAAPNRPCSCRVFLSISARMSRYSGSCFRRALIRTWSSAETAWLGGRV
ncbi:hypothetical protein D3C83_08540 [compost metagenome]